MQAVKTCIDVVASRTTIPLVLHYLDRGISLSPRLFQQALDPKELLVARLKLLLCLGVHLIKGWNEYSGVGS